MTYYKQKNNNSVVSKQKGSVALNSIIISVLFGLSIFYLVQINTLVARNFELLVFEKELKQSQEKNQSLSVSLTQQRSLENLQAAAKSLNLVTVEKTNYLKVAPHFFALSD